MERVLGDLRGKNCFVYIDNIIIYSNSLDQHVKDLNAMLSRPHKANLSLNMKKMSLLQVSAEVPWTCSVREGG